MYGRSLLVLTLTATLLNGCAASQKAFYSDASKIKNTQLCRTAFEAYQKEGNSKYVLDLAAEARRRGLDDEQCRKLVETEDAVLVAALVGATITGVAIACSQGCAAPSGAGAYRSTYAGYTDVDCLGGTGDGPRYTSGYGPFPINAYNDPYDLDRDGDGIACELGEGG